MRKYSNIVKLILIGILLLATVLFVRAFFSDPVLGEAYIGSFEASDFSEGWTMIDEKGNVTENVTLPIDVESENGEMITLRNIVPYDVRDGMSLGTRASMSEIRIAINGIVRGEYTKNNFLVKRRPISSFLVVNLYDTDANGQIEIFITPSRNGVSNINTVSYAYGNNVWFPYIKENIPFVAMGALLILTGIGSMLAFLFISRKTGTNRSVFYLGLMTLEIGMWMIGENQLRQLIFGSPSYASVFVYLLIETAAGFGAMYFDEIQNHRYHKPYMVLVTLLVAQVIINTILNFANVAEFFYTLKFSHIWSGLIILWILITIILDIRAKLVGQYKLTVIGMIGFLVSGLLEIVTFYVDPSAKLGNWLGAGLIFLMAATLLQTVKNLVAASEERRAYSEKMNEMILQTIESAMEEDEEPNEDRTDNLKDGAGISRKATRVVVVDDAKPNLIAASRILSDKGIHVTGLSSGEELLEYVRTNRPDLILLDVYMPGMDGFETLEKLREFEAGKDTIPVIFLTGSDDYKTETKGLQLGAMDFIRKPFAPDVLTLRVKNSLELVRLQKDLSSEVRQKAKENEALSFHVVQTLAEAIDAKDTYTNGHSTRVAQYSREIARRYGYSRQDQDEIYMMGLLHDVGKIGVPDEVINKTGKLTDEEFALIKEHPVIGYHILVKIKEMPRLQIGAHWHHERYDGKGYPDGLSGSDIPEEARIIAVADAYDAMTSRRSYRDILPQDTVRDEIEKGKDKQFDAKFADIMLEIIAEDVVYGLREK